MSLCLLQVVALVSGHKTQANLLWEASGSRERAAGCALLRGPVRTPVGLLGASWYAANMLVC